MDQHEIKIMGWTGMLLAVFLTATLLGVSRYATDVPDCVPYDAAFLEPKVTRLDSNLYQVNLLAQMWNFEPSEIYLPVGAEVDFYLTSKDVVHGFHIANKNLNMMAVPGGVNKMTVKFDQPGVYEMICHEYCGSGHQHMRGEVIVNYPVK
jgi:cytochrome c oxidase subunit 2